MGVKPSHLTHLRTMFYVAKVKRWTQKSKIAGCARVCARARFGGMYMGEEAVWYIDALPVFLKIVVGLREKVDDFQRLSGCFCRDAQWFSEQMGFRYLGWCSNDAVYTIFAQVPFSPKIIGYSLIAFLLLFFPLVYVSRLNGVVVPCKNTGSIRHGVPAI